MANGASSVKSSICDSKTLTTTFTSQEFGLPPIADEIGIETSIESGSAIALTSKIQHKVGSTWVDLTGATGNTVLDSNAAANAEINFASKPNSGTTRINCSTVTLYPTKVVASASIANATESWTSASHTYITGTAVTLTTSSALPSPLVVATTYFLYVVDANTFKVCSTYANAVATTAIDITTDGVGNQTVTPVPLVISSKICYGKKH